MSRHIRTTVRLPDELMKQARRRAAELDITLTSMIEDGLRVVLATPSKAIRKRSLPPVSRSAGKVLVDLGDSSAILEQLDRGLPLEKLR